MESSINAKEGNFLINIVWYHVFIFLNIQGVINKGNVIIY